MITIGINAYHADSSACVIKDGQLLAAVEEERFRRVKHWAGFPSKSVEFCLEQAGVSLEAVDIIALNTDPGIHKGKKLAYAIKNRPDLSLLVDRLKTRRQRNSIEDVIAQTWPQNQFKGKIIHVEHHLAHLASAYFAAPYDKATVVSVDGFGDFASTAWGEGKAGQITLDGRVWFPHSLGIFYQALTQYLGFPHYGDEYKVMGLAPYGEDVYNTEMAEIVQLKEQGEFELNLKYFRHHREKTSEQWEGGIPSYARLYARELEHLLGPARQKGEELTQKHMNLAYSIQKMYERAFFHLLNALHSKYGGDSICVAGGCGMNSVANGKIALNTPYKNIYIQSAAGDAGGALGAAYIAAQNAGEILNDAKMPHAYLGPSYSDQDFDELLDKNKQQLSESEFHIQQHDKLEVLAKTVAELMSEGKVIGWFQGALEWGPRALGHRSILCDPRRADMKDILNAKIKRRESFRPFAPSVLRSAVSDWFEQDDEVPFMMKVFQIKKEKRSLIPAVTHVDGSGRLQTVQEDHSPGYHALISAFYEKTGIPMVLNTSFNENEPVVCRPEEALACFLRTKMDVLVLGHYVVRRL